MNDQQDRPEDAGLREQLDDALRYLGVMRVERDEAQARVERLKRDMVAIAEQRNEARAALAALSSQPAPDAGLRAALPNHDLLLAYLERFIDFGNGGATHPQYVTANGIRQDMPRRLHADALALRAALAALPQPGEPT